MKKYFLLTVCCFALLAGCKKRDATEVIEIRAGDSMESVVARLNEWNAQEVYFSRYSVYVPTEPGDTRSHKELRGELIVKHPFSELPAYALPNGLVVDFQSEGHTLTSISQEIDVESKGKGKTIDGFTGIRYDGDWRLIGSASSKEE